MVRHLLALAPALLLSLARSPCAAVRVHNDAAAAEPAAAATAFKQSQFVVGGGPDPPPSNESYSSLVGAGLTFVHADTDEVTSVAGAKVMASLCATHSLSCVLPLVAAGAVQTNGRSVWGYFVHDEPKGKDFPGLAAQVASIRKTHPMALSFINLLGYVNMSTEQTMALYGFATYEEYVDSFIRDVKPDVLSYDCYPEYSRMDNMHYNLALHRNKSLAAGIPMWNYIWLSSNGHGHGAGFYRWQLWASVAYGTKGIMQWSVSPCGNIHACGPKDRWAPYPCLLDKHGAPFKPVYNMARAEHNKLVALGPLLLSLTSQSVVRLAPAKATPVVRLEGMPLRSISTGPWVIGHLNRTAAHQHGESAFNDCVVVVNDDPINTGFPAMDLGPSTDGLIAKEVDQETGKLVSVTNDAPDVAGFHLWFQEGGARIFCWGPNTTDAASD